ncbi:MAG: hypothetical protein RL511_745 [Bacteroidota bacterium]
MNFSGLLAFDACKTKKPAGRLAFQLFCGERGISLRENPFIENSKQSKSQLLRNFTFFISNCLQKQAFDALKQKSQPDG